MCQQMKHRRLAPCCPFFDFNWILLFNVSKSILILLYNDNNNVEKNAIMICILDVGCYNNIYDHIDSIR